MARMRTEGTLIHGIAGGFHSHQYDFLGYDQNELYCVGKVRKTNSRGFVVLSYVIVVKFHRVAYCVVVFNLLVGSKVVALHPQIGRIT